MKIYVVLSHLIGYEQENVFVGTENDLEKIRNMKPTDFKMSKYLSIEVWENGTKIGYLKDHEIVSNEHFIESSL